MPYFQEYKPHPDSFLFVVKYSHLENEGEDSTAAAVLMVGSYGGIYHYMHQQ